MKKLSNPVHNDHLEEIIRRLPVKQLTQCKSISKYWNNVISRPRFTFGGRSRSHSPNRTLLNYQGIMFVYPRHQGGESISCAKPWGLKSLRVTLNTTVVGTCDGLICVSSTKTGTYAWVFNPVSKETQTCHFDEPIRNTSYFFGFGFDVVNNDYKIVKITQSKDEETSYVEIQNLHTKVSSLSSNQVSLRLTKAAPVTVNGHSHWIGVNLQTHKLEIVRFDFSNEKFVNVPFSNDMPNINSSHDIDSIVREQPNTELELEGVTDSLLRRIQEQRQQPKTELEVEGLKLRLGVFKGSVCLLVTYSTKVEVWCMKYKENWNREFEIEFRPHPAKEREAVGFTANDELVIGYKSGEKSYHYIAWNPGTKQSLFAIGVGHFYLNQVVAYEESVVPVKLKPPTP